MSFPARLSQLQGSSVLLELNLFHTSFPHRRRQGWRYMGSKYFNDLMHQYGMWQRLRSVLCPVPSCVASPNGKGVRLISEEMIINHKAVGWLSSAIFVIFSLRIILNPRRTPSNHHISTRITFPTLLPIASLCVASLICRVRSTGKRSRSSLVWRGALRIPRPSKRKRNFF